MGMFDGESAPILLLPGTPRPGRLRLATTEFDRVATRFKDGTYAFCSAQVWGATRNADIAEKSGLLARRSTGTSKADRF